MNDYFPAAGAEAGAAASTAAAFLCFLCFLVAAGAEAGAAASTAGVAGAGGVAGVAAKAETANRLATKAAIMVFILDPIKLKHVKLSNPHSNNGMGSLRLTITFRMPVYF